MRRLVRIGGKSRSKTVSICVLLDEFLLIRNEAARRRVSIGGLLREWIRLELNRQRRDHPVAKED